MLSHPIEHHYVINDKSDHAQLQEDLQRIKLQLADDCFKVMDLLRHSENKTMEVYYMGVLCGYKECLDLLNDIK